MKGNGAVSSNVRGPLSVLIAVLALLASLMFGLQSATAATGDLHAAILTPYCNGVAVVAPVSVDNRGAAAQDVELYVDGALKSKQSVPAGSTLDLTFDLSAKTTGSAYALEARADGVAIDSFNGTVPVCGSSITGTVTASGCSVSAQRPLVQYFINNDGAVQQSVSVKVDGQSVGTVDVDPGGASQGELEIPVMPQGQSYRTSLTAGSTLVYSGIGQAIDCANIDDTGFNVTRTTCTALQVDGGMDYSASAVVTLRWENDGPQSVTFDGTGDPSATSWQHTFVAVPNLPLDATDVRLTATAGDVILHNSTVNVTACSPPTPIAGPSVLGSPTVGATLTCSVRYDEASQVGFKWYVDGQAIRGATRSVFTLTGDQFRRRVTCGSAGVNSGGWGTVALSGRLYISGLGPKIRSTQDPIITGTKRVGSSVKVWSYGRWSVSPTKITCTWLRSGKAISRATRCSGYTLTASDRGRTIGVRLYASRSGYPSGYGYSRAWKVS